MKRWSAVRLSEIAAPAGRTANGDIDLPVYSVTKHRGFVPSLEYFRKQVFSRELGTYTLVEPGDFAYATIHLDEGSIGISPERCLISPMYTAFRVISDCAHPPFVLRYLKGPRALAQYARMGRGSIPRRRAISFERLSTLEIPLPSPSEQRRIAEILDTADALQAKRRAALAHLDALVQSAFTATFLAGLDGPAVDTVGERRGRRKGWDWLLLTDVARLATGHTPDRGRNDYWNGEIPWISLADIRGLNGTIATDTTQNISALGVQNSSAVRLPPGTVCFSRTASLGFVTVMGREMATSQDFVNWVCGDRIEPVYLMWALLNAQQRLCALSTGSTHRTIYMRVAEQFRVLVPPIERQKRFAQLVRRAWQQRRAQEQSAAQLANLFESLQLNAFRGEL